MSGRYRVGGAARIDRGRRIGFRFDGKRFEGHPGDTLASALLANGVRLVGRSFKYHRPRGIMAAGAEEPNALVGVGRTPDRHTPNVRATCVELHEGLEATSQNRFPSLRFDVGAVNGLAGPLLPAGFYYKTFMWPRRFWRRVYEPLIRRAAGLGRAPTDADPDRYLNRFAHCDVLVAGGGPAGLAAALAAGRSGARVMLCDEGAELGGSLLSDRSARVDGLPGPEWVARVAAELAVLPNVTVLVRTTVFSYGAHNFLGAVERVTDHLAAPDPDLPRERMWQVRAGEVVLAAGAIERPLVFAGNDRPGVMLAGAARTYLNRYGVACGRRAVVVTGNDSAYRTALDLHAAGVRVRAVVELRAARDTALSRAVRAAGIPVLSGTVPVRAFGGIRVRGLAVAAVGADGTIGRRRHLAADLVLMCGGWTPAVHLFSQARGTLRFDEAVGGFVPGVAAERCVPVGACRGQFGLEAALHDGAEAGVGAAGRAGFGTKGPGIVVAAADGVDLAVATELAGSRHVSAKAFVDHQNDVTAKDILLATREGFRSIEHVKRYTTNGMATDQGKTSNMAALGLVAGALGVSVPEVGLTTFRMPYTPTSFGAFAGAARGALFDPIRRTPIDGWAAERGAVFEDVSLWKRARYFPQGAETMEQAVLRECGAVRAGVGIFDASTLGKIEVVGADAAEFMNRLYVNNWTRLGVGRCRYGLMCREDGFVFDDGVVGRLAQDRFHVTTTTGGAARVLGLMEDYGQTEWPELDVWLTSTTEQWAVVALQGPRARDVLAPLVDGLAIDAASLPHMGLVEGTIGGVPMRLFRVSFTGELGFEVNVPARHGLAVWERIFAAGARFGIVPYGTEAMHVLRAEKGYVIVGQDTDGTATPDDIGYGGLIARAKRDFVGKRSLDRASMQRADRRQLVGLLPEDASLLLEEGAALVASADAPAPVRMLGHVTSSYRSAALGRGFALAMLSGGRRRIGERVFATSLDGTPVPVRVTGTVFYDEAGSRLDA